jgi:integrase
MATIMTRKGKNRTTYTVRVRIAGRPAQVKTFDRKTDAKEWAAKMETDIRRGRTLGGRRTVGEAIDYYLAHHVARLAESDLRNRVRQLAWWKERIGGVLLDDLGAGHVREHLRTLTGRKVATVNRYHAALSAVLSQAAAEEWMESNPLHRARRGIRPNSEREEERDREVAEEEWNRLRAACRRSPDPRLYVLVVCAFASGARESELMGMEWRRCDLAPVFHDPATGEARPGVPRAEVVNTKNGSSRMLYFPGEAGEVLRERRRLAPLSRYVFAQPGDAPDKLPRFPTQAWWYWRNKAGLADVRFHDLRHSWACRLLDSGATLPQIMILGGWKTANMVRRYASRAQRHGSDAVEAMHSRMIQRKI